MNCTPALQNPAEALSGRALCDAYSGWLLHGDLEGWSRRTIDDRGVWLGRMQEFLTARELAFDANGLRAFFLALSKGTDGRGRKPLKPASVKHVHTLLKAFGTWCVEESFLTGNPMKRIPSPILKDAGIEPFEDAELKRVLAAAGTQGRQPVRDTALVTFLADTGMRASEVCALRLRDVDLSARTAQVRSGKGGKARMVSFGKATAQALWRHLRAEPRDADDFLFTGERGAAMTRGGLAQLMRRIGKAAGVKGVHPHRFRHDACCRLLRNGANVFQVQQQLGHSRVSTTEIYVAISQADLRAMSAAASPMDNLNGTRR